MIMSDKTNDNESTPTTIQNYDGGEQIDAEELAAILEQAGAGDEGCAQIVDADGNILTLTAEQLAQAGIDISNIGEADVETLLQLAQGATNSAASGGSIEVSVGSGSTTDGLMDSKSPKKRPSVDLQSSEVGESMSKKFKLDTSMVQHHEEGLEDEEITELDEQTLASLVQSGTVKFVDEAGNEIPAASVLAGSQASVISSDLMPATSDERKSHPSKASRSGTSSSASKVGTNYALVGSEVEVKRGNRRVPATVRYVRQGIGYKVQFEDGRFEWVNENEVIINGVTPVGGGDSSSGVAGDHEYLVDDQDDEGLIDGPGSLSNFKQGGPPPVLTPQQPASSLAKRPMNGMTGGGGGSTNAGRKSFQHVHPDRSNQSSSGGRNESKNSSSGTNFVCPICETKVFNKEPSYIVIRLPACDDCAESKILVLDDNATK